MQSSWQTTWYARALVLVSVADVLVHAVSQQFELARALVALVLVLWVQAWSQRRWVGWSVVVLYVLVNGWFIGQAGLVNPDTGAPRIVWLLIVGTTLALSSMCLYQQSRR
jgi:hypothetical protein